MGNLSHDFTDTVGGIDASGNGVRDDIEQFIEVTYLEPFQGSLLEGKTRESAVVAEQAIYRALDCTKHAFGKDWAKLTPDVTAMTLNTHNRVMAYAEAEKLGSGYLLKSSSMNRATRNENSEESLHPILASALT